MYRMNKKGTYVNETVRDRSVRTTESESERERDKRAKEKDMNEGWKRMNKRKRDKMKEKGGEREK